MKRIILKGKHGVDKFALVDDEDFDKLNQWQWYCSTYGYAVRHAPTNNGKRNTIWMHRLILNPPKNRQIDHRDRNRLNNQKSNIRICSNSQNNMNKRTQRNNTTGYKGIYIKHGFNIHARIIKDQTVIHLGRFPDKISAAKAYDKKAKELFGEFARLNFPD